VKLNQTRVSVPRHCFHRPASKHTRGWDKVICRKCQSNVRHEQYASRNRGNAKIFVGYRFKNKGISQT